jgi:hypothetical protein
MSFTRHEPPFLSETQLIAFVDGVDTQYSASIERASFAANAQGKFTLPAGMFVAETGGVRSLLKRANITQAFVGVEGFVDLWQLFAVGDQLTIVEPYIRLTVTALSVGTNVTFAIDDHSEVFTFAGTIGATPTDAATEIAGWITRTSRVMSQYVTAIALGPNVHLFASDGFTRHTIGVTGGTIALSFGDGKMHIDEPFGTIAQIDNRAEPGKITLASAPTHPLPVGAHLGVPAKRIFGFINNSIDLTYTDRENFAIVSGANGVYEGKLPYIDADIKRQTPGIKYEHNF